MLYGKARTMFLWPLFFCAPSFRLISFVLSRDCPQKINSLSLKPIQSLHDTIFFRYWHTKHHKNVTASLMLLETGSVLYFALAFFPEKSTYWIPPPKFLFYWHYSLALPCLPLIPRFKTFNPVSQFVVVLTIFTGPPAKTIL